MGTFIPSPTATVIYSGDSAILNQWRRSEAYDLAVVSHADLLRQLDEIFPHAHTLILSMFTLRAGRVEIPLDPTDMQASNPAFEILNRLSKLTERPNVILLTHNGTPLEVCCQAVRLGVAHFIDTDAPGWEARLTHAIEQVPILSLIHI